MERKLRMGMIGGGYDAFIGEVHREAARLDNMIDLVCGSFSTNYEKSVETGKRLFLDADRVYKNYEQMVLKEKELPQEKRMQLVSIVTPNHVHFAPAKLALENGFHVILDKPMTFNLKEAEELQRVVHSSQLHFCLTHTYTGYPMVKEAKQIIREDKMGKVRKIYVEYPQSWLSTFLEGTVHKQASWRTDPSRSGIAGCMGDIGTHAFNLAEYVSGLETTKICADLNIVVKGRKLDDDGAVFLKYNNGASGVLTASQIAAGEENDIRIRVYCEEGSIGWSHRDANSLHLKWLNKPEETLRCGNDYLSSYAQANTRLPAGHPEGYLEAFANLYKNFALTIDATMNNKTPQPEWTDFPDVEDGVRGMRFIEKVVASSKAEKKWIDF